MTLRYYNLIKMLARRPRVAFDIIFYCPRNQIYTSQLSQRSHRAVFVGSWNRFKSEKFMQASLLRCKLVYC